MSSVELPASSILASVEVGLVKGAEVFEEAVEVTVVSGLTMEDAKAKVEVEDEKPTGETGSASETRLAGVSCDWVEIPTASVGVVVVRVVGEVRVDTEDVHVGSLSRLVYPAPILAGVAPAEVVTLFDGLAYTVCSLVDVVVVVSISGLKLYARHAC